MASGEAGELWVKTHNMLLGYHQGPDAPWLPPTLSEGWFRTRDWGRQRPDGSFVLLGRLDDRFKDRRGEYLFPDEVERWMRDIPGVAEAAFSPLGEGDWWLFVTPAAGEQLDSAEVERQAHLRLGPLRAPTGCSVLTALPRNNNGKLARHILREIQREQHPL